MSESEWKAEEARLDDEARERFETWRGPIVDARDFRKFLTGAIVSWWGGGMGVGFWLNGMARFVVDALPKGYAKAHTPDRRVRSQFHLEIRKPIPVDVMRDAAVAGRDAYMDYLKQFED